MFNQKERFSNNGGGNPRANQSRLVSEMLSTDPEQQVLFVGSVNCLRHKPFSDIGVYMQQGRAAILSPTMSDFSSGRYLSEVKEAIVELSKERGSKRFVIICGCQWVILSTDGELLCKELKDEYDLDVTIREDDHLEHGDHA